MIATAEALYGALIRLYPHAFWRQFHEELEADFAEGCREARETGRRFEVVGFWIRVAADLATSLVREWLRTPWLPVLLIAGAISILIFGFTALRVSRWPRVVRWPAPVALHSSADPNGDALKLIIVMAIGSLIPIVGTILGSLWIQLLRRSMSRRRRPRV